MRMREMAKRLLAAGILIGLVTAGCGGLNFIKKRLPPPTETAEGVRFRFYAPSARTVQLAGNWPWNNWLAGQAQTGSFLVGEMTDEDGDGVWERVEELPPGRYEYKFVIDRVNWKEDPNNPQKLDDGYGGFNSLLVLD